MITDFYSRSRNLIILVFVLLFISGFSSCSGGKYNPINAGLEGPDNSDSPEITMNPVPDEQIQAMLPDRESQVLWDVYNDTLVDFGNEPGSAVTLYKETDAYNRHAFKYIGGSVDELDDPNDWFYIDLSHITLSGSRVLYADLVWSSGDWLNLYIYDHLLNPIAYLNQDTGSPKIIWLDQLQPTENWYRYYIRVRAAQGAGDYLLKVGTKLDHTAPGNDNNINDDLFEWDDSYWPYPYSITNNVNSEFDKNDYYKLTIDQDMLQLINVHLDWLGSPDANLNVYLYDENYTPIASANTNGRPESFSVKKLNLNEGETYYLRVLALQGAAVYELQVGFKDIIIFPPGLFKDFIVFIPLPLPPDPEGFFDFIPPAFGNPPDDNGPQFPSFGY